MDKKTWLGPESARSNRATHRITQTHDNTQKKIQKHTSTTRTLQHTQTQTLWLLGRHIADSMKNICTSEKSNYTHSHAFACVVGKAGAHREDKNMIYQCICMDRDIKAKT